MGVRHTCTWILVANANETRSVVASRTRHGWSVVQHSQTLGTLAFCDRPHRLNRHRSCVCVWRVMLPQIPLNMSFCGGVYMSFSVFSLACLRIYDLETRAHIGGARSTCTREASRPTSPRTVHAESRGVAIGARNKFFKNIQPYKGELHDEY